MFTCGPAFLTLISVVRQLPSVVAINPLLKVTAAVLSSEIKVRLWPHLIVS